MKYISIGLVSVIFYFLCFSIISYPLILQFSTHFFADQGDGLLHVWNLWWVNKAVVSLHQSPWWTPYLYYPDGISLLGHTLNPFNGFVGIILLKFLTLIQAHNFIVVFCFVIGGLTAFFLSYYFTRAYWPSFIAGAIFTFSNYHFAHAQGHLNLVSLEWIPLFVLCFYILITRPGIFAAIGSAIVLFLVFLCDYYYFLYSILIGSLVVIWYAVKERELFFLRRRYLIPLTVFIALIIVLTAPLIISLIHLNIRDPLWGASLSRMNSLDLLAPFIPGGHWRFAHLTRGYWSKLPSNIHESSVHMGITVVFLLIYVWIKRRRLQIQSLGLWYLGLIFFAVMSLGPVLHIWGREIPFIRLPYALFENVFPPLRLSGAPVRMMVMVMLSAGVISAMAFKMLFQKPRGRFLAGAILVMLFFEYLPSPMPASEIPIPEYIKFLRDLPREGGIIDTVSWVTPSMALYYQVIHQKPMAFGDVSRIPESLRKKERKLRGLIKDREYARIYYDYNIRYLITDASTEITGCEILYHDGGVKLYDLGK